MSASTSEVDPSLEERLAQIPNWDSRTTRLASAMTAQLGTDYADTTFRKIALSYGSPPDVKPSTETSK